MDLFVVFNGHLPVLKQPLGKCDLSSPDRASTNVLVTFRVLIIADHIMLNNATDAQVQVRDSVEINDDQRGLFEFLESDTSWNVEHNHGSGAGAGGGGRFSCGC